MLTAQRSAAPGLHLTARRRCGGRFQHCEERRTAARRGLLSYNPKGRRGVSAPFYRSLLQQTAPFATSSPTTGDGRSAAVLGPRSRSPREGEQAEPGAAFVCGQDGEDGPDGAAERPRGAAHRHGPRSQGRSPRQPRTEPPARPSRRPPPLGPPPGQAASPAAPPAAEEAPPLPARLTSSSLRRALRRTRHGRRRRGGRAEGTALTRRAAPPHAPRRRAADNGPAAAGGAERGGAEGGTLPPWPPMGAGLSASLPAADATPAMPVSRTPPTGGTAQRGPSEADPPALPASRAACAAPSRWVPLLLRRNGASRCRAARSGQRGRSRPAGKQRSRAQPRTRRAPAPPPLPFGGPRARLRAVPPRAVRGRAPSAGRSAAGSGSGEAAKRTGETRPEFKVQNAPLIIASAEALLWRCAFLKGRRSP